MAPLADGRRGRFGRRQPFPSSGKKKQKDPLRGARIFRVRVEGQEGVKGKVIDVVSRHDARKREYKVLYEDGQQECLTADQVRECLQKVLKCPKFLLAYHVTMEDNVANILKNGFQMSDNPGRCRMGKGAAYFFTGEQRAVKCMKRVRENTGRTVAILTCSLRTGGTLFYAGQRNFFKAQWVGGQTKVVLGRHYGRNRRGDPMMNQGGHRFHEMLARDSKDIKVLKIDQQPRGRPFRAKKVPLPILPKGTYLWEYVPSRRK